MLFLLSRGNESTTATDWLTLISYHSLLSNSQFFFSNTVSRISVKCTTAQKQIIIKENWTIAKQTLHFIMLHVSCKPTRDNLVHTLVLYLLFDRNPICLALYIY